jgi:hypothetical protein
MTVRATWIFSGVVVLMGGCDADDGAVGFVDDGEAVALRAVVDNGIQLNGIQLNGIQLNGIQLNGIQLNGDNGSGWVKATEFKYDTLPAQAVWLDNSQLIVRDYTGVVRSGTDMLKLKVKFDVYEGGSLKSKTVKINNAQLLAPDVWVYDLSLKIDAGVWAPLCIDGAGQPTQAILLNDLWSPTTGDRRPENSAAMTYACRGAALAKCIEWGYKPWSLAEGVSLDEYHQACTRMVRADYCGTGTAHTINGTRIHVVDELGVQDVDPTVTYAVEAEWGPDGAVCLNSANTRLPGQTIECQIPSCGTTAFSSGGIMQSGTITSP